MHSSRFIAALASAVAFGAAAGGAHAQTSPPVMTMAPQPAGPGPAGQATPGSAPGAHPGANADTPAPAVPGTPAAPGSFPASPAAPDASTPLPPVHTMAPRPLPGGPGGLPGTVPGTPALNARALRAHRTATGYVLTGQAQVKDGCQAARFDPSLLAIYPPQLNLVQFRNPANRGVMCMQMVRWVAAAPRTVTSTKPPAFITVRTAAGTTRVPIR